MVVKLSFREDGLLVWKGKIRGMPLHRLQSLPISDFDVRSELLDRFDIQVLPSTLKNLHLYFVNRRTYVPP